MPRLYKKEKLCSVIAIDQLFVHGGGADIERAIAYPLRALWRPNQRRSSDAPVQFLISVPKRKIRHAVDRVAMRRRVREAYRLNRDRYPLPEGMRIDVAFIYIADRRADYAAIQHGVCRLLHKIQQWAQSQIQTADEAADTQ